MSGMEILDIDVFWGQASGQLDGSLGCSFQVILPALCTFIMVPPLPQDSRRVCTLPIIHCPSLPGRPLYYSRDMLYIRSLSLPQPLIITQLG